VGDPIRGSPEELAKSKLLKRTHIKK